MFSWLRPRNQDSEASGTGIAVCVVRPVIVLAKRRVAVVRISTAATLVERGTSVCLTTPLRSVASSDDPRRPLMPSEQHEQWKQALLDLLIQRLIPCHYCAMSIRSHHPPWHAFDPNARPSQYITWTCSLIHDHIVDVLGGAVHVVAERRLPLLARPSDGQQRPRYCVPDLTVIDEHGEPTALIEVVHTHPPARAVLAAAERDIPLFVVPAPLDWMMSPGLEPQAPWVQTADDHAMRAAMDAFNRGPEIGDAGRRFEYSTFEDDDRHLVFGRYTGSLSDPQMAPLPLHGGAIQAARCTWSCDRAHEAFSAQWSARGPEAR